ncbi:uncharacterized protein LOC131877785 isoform X2 [Tigriopus californicus]|uniref:uncharacterized protein LOC131877785 isoform X2 n=1 Tax=Tigriopus californicus TaxID=6832 RepID=UPI0027DA433C|nr:uncharacterized protein LOC131877785 isoform X2 [Tigriopus californicus]
MSRSPSSPCREVSRVRLPGPDLASSSLCSSLSNGTCLITRIKLRRALDQDKPGTLRSVTIADRLSHPGRPMVMLRRPLRWSSPSVVLFCFGLAFLTQIMFQMAAATPLDRNLASLAARDELSPEELSEVLRGDPSYVLGMLSQLRSSILKPLEKSSRSYFRRPTPTQREELEPDFSNKRAIDFGLGRGYSGNQAAKHFMGLVASQYAGGPGKKRKRVDPGVLMNPKYSSTTMQGRRR